MANRRSLILGSRCLRIVDGTHRRLTVAAAGITALSVGACRDANSVEPTRCSVSSPSSVLELQPGAVVRVEAAVTCPQGTTQDNIRWSIADARIATVGPQGEVRGIAAGETTIEITVANDPTARASLPLRVTTQPNCLNSGLKVTPSTFSLVSGATQKVTVVKPSCGTALTDSTVRFASSDTTIATVDASGVVTGKTRGVGIATITAYLGSAPGTNGTAVATVMPQS